MTATITRETPQSGQTATQPAAGSKAPTREELIALLNQDLMYEYQAVVMYTTYAALVEGPVRPHLAAFFKSEIPGELAHAQFLADKIASLGGIPETQAAPVSATKEPREMLESVLAAEERAIQAYTERSRQAEAFGDIGLKVQLENFAADETGHRDEVKRILDGWR
jgi:bacterioferritin